ncbi:MAG: ABC transporter ATP-binding protein [Candidatus Eremiobacteraeota bacterium]|nr:ABC transporter ATP-binding protein [Candidatus Eremiobacteraeota bacterium]
MFTLCRALWRHADGYRRTVLLYTTMSLLAVLVQLAAPLLMAQLMNSLSQPGIESRAGGLLGLYALTGVIFWCLHGPSRVLETTVAFHIKRAFQVSLMEKVTALPVRWHRAHHSGQTIDQVSKGVTALGEFAEGGFELLHLLARFVGSVALLIWLMPLAGLTMIAVTGLTALVVVLFDKKLVPQYEGLNLAYNRVAAAVQDYLTNISTVISLRLEGRVVREVRSRIQAIYPLYRKNTVLNEWKWFTTGRLVDFSQVGLLLVLIFSHKAKVGTVYAVSEYLRNLGDVFYQFTWKYGVIVMQSARVRGVEHIEQAYQTVAVEASLPEDWREILIKDLSFSHHDRPILQIDRLQLKRGRSYAFVGESGSGKSSLLGVLRGLHQPAQQPEVLCDGVKLKHGLVHLNHQATLIPQDPEIFSDSILFNVTLGVECAPERVQKAIQMARFQKTLERLPRGLDTNIAEKGVSLSGGERQRLALARGLFFEGEIRSGLVLLDEPTSSVDSANERLIYEALLSEFRDVCVVSALHKFHLLPLFDEVVVFQDGRIVQAGPVAGLPGGELGRLVSHA